MVFVSHCLLNENTRYLGGACRQGAVREIVQACLDAGVGIVQMPCPEQHAWGGVLKRRLLWFYGAEGTMRYRLGVLTLPLLLWWTRRKYRRLARQVGDQLADYHASACSVVGIIGVDGSPSCGVRRTVDMRPCLEQLGRLRPAARAEDVNAIVGQCAIDGTGMFVAQLQKEIARRRLAIPFHAHDLVTELRGGAAPWRF